MATLLVNRRMSPALAARIEASLRGRPASGARRSFTPRLVSLLRAAGVLLVVLAGYLIAVTVRRERRELERTRHALLLRVTSHSAALTDADRTVVARVQPWLTRAAGAYEGDLVSDELRAPGGLDATLARPTIYVRGPLPSFASGAAAIDDAAAASGKDPLLTCLVEPPASRAEKAVLARVRAAYSGEASLAQRTANVHRLRDAEVGLPFLAPAWAARVEGAEDVPALEKLGRDLDRAPIEEAKRAAKATLLVAAVDEPGTGAGPTELDGERPHDVRVWIVDLAGARALARVRRHVDPGWVSAAKRPEYASGLDGCLLAMDVREAMTARR